eukprot:3611658-Pyramimonas_sp.AAC.1
MEDRTCSGGGEGNATAIFRGETGLPMPYMWYVPNPEDTTQKTLIAEWGPTKGWNLYGANLTHVQPGINQVQFLQTLRCPNH